MRSVRLARTQQHQARATRDVRFESSTEWSMGRSAPARDLRSAPAIQAALPSEPQNKTCGRSLAQWARKRRASIYLATSLNSIVCIAVTDRGPSQGLIFA